jgi:hypothetical protein
MRGLFQDVKGFLGWAELPTPLKQSTWQTQQDLDKQIKSLDDVERLFRAVPVQQPLWQPRWTCCDSWRALQVNAVEPEDAIKFTESFNRYINILPSTQHPG